MLDTITSNTRAEVESRKSRLPLSTLRLQAEKVPVARDFRKSLQKDNVALIAEIKRKSPSRGSLREIDAPSFAKIYQSHGASAISVLTDSKFFGGSLADLENVRKSVDLPLLRKDFIIDEYQIYEAKAFQADAFLLIARILSDNQIHDYLTLANELGIGTLTEVHDERELERAIKANAPVIGINNRDLGSFTVNLAVTERLAPRVPSDRLLVAESGVFNQSDVERVARAGVHAILVGEGLVRAHLVEEKIKELTHVCRQGAQS